MSEQLPVTVAVRRPDGSVEQVRVGTASRTQDGFSLQLGELSIGAVPDAPARSAAAPQARPAGAGGGMSLPNYGRSKGAPVVGASMQDLEYYANGCRRTLADPGKSRWHDKERELLAAIEAEIARQGGGGGGGGGYAVPSEGPRWSAPADPEPPPHGDDDIPF